MSANALRAVLICLLAAVATPAATASDEFRDYPEFRYTSALPGGGWGVSQTGEPGFEGALQINVPVAYTPHEGVIIGYSCGSHDSTPRFNFKGSRSNGTATIALGLGASGHGIYLCEMGTGHRWEPSQNIQVQIRPEDEEGPAFALGIQDILSQRNRTTPVTERGGAISYYLVGTCQRQLGDRPLYITAGIGSGRFNSTVFGGLSYRAADRLTVLAEHDGFNVNVGGAYDLSSALTDYTTVFAGLVDLERPVLGMTYVYR